MGTLDEKLEYLVETKAKILHAIEYLMRRFGFQDALFSEGSFFIT